MNGFLKTSFFFCSLDFLGRTSYHLSSYIFRQTPITSIVLSTYTVIKSSLFAFVSFLPHVLVRMTRGLVDSSHSTKTIDPTCKFSLSKNRCDFNVKLVDKILLNIWRHKDRSNFISLCNYTSLYNNIKLLSSLPLHNYLHLKLKDILKELVQLYFIKKNGGRRNK